ncbi:alpha/beta fold hydrolase [Bacillus taeanensis]|uniref:Alpha/beta hydrolase n=1 Tax=Bacillus taeanensis TaxID=273032 RepID=A0A366XZJ9_9BACI|nr:alpha/beta hydrolase [Bacillus taeanensis]RBW71357.1 alpha/beta hydrolase [Bacillus taeanensis]
MPYAAIHGDMPLYYEVRGKGIPILFIHPPAMGHVTFKKQAPLAEHCQVITFDMRGHGSSGTTNEKITIKLLADDILALLDHLSIEKAVLFGYSNGGSIAQEFVLSYPERSQGLILCGGFSEVNSFLLYQEFLLGIATAKLKGLTLLGKILSKAHCAEKDFKKELESSVKKTNPAVLYQMYTKGLSYNCTKRLSQIDVPLLLIYGAMDFYVHHYKNLFLQAVKKTDVVYVSKARHQVPTRHYHECNKIIEGYIKSHFKGVNNTMHSNHSTQPFRTESSGQTPDGHPAFRVYMNETLVAEVRGKDPLNQTIIPMRELNDQQEDQFHQFLVSISSRKGNYNA